MPNIDIPTTTVKFDIDELETLAQEIEQLTFESGLQIGKRLARGREIFRYRRDLGGFTGWVEKRLGYSVASAYRLLNLHERFAESFSRWKTLEVTALYALAAPGCPEEAIEKIAGRIDAGEKPTIAEVRETIATYVKEKGQIDSDNSVTTEDQAGQGEADHLASGVGGVDGADQPDGDIDDGDPDDDDDDDGDDDDDDQNDDADDDGDLDGNHDDKRDDVRETLLEHFSRSSWEERKIVIDHVKELGAKIDPFQNLSMMNPDQAAAKIQAVLGTYKTQLLMDSLQAQLTPKSNGKSKPTISKSLTLTGCRLGCAQLRGGAKG
jgi:hypothetical protein